jgi:hypothetical protein
MKGTFSPYCSVMRVLNMKLSNQQQSDEPPRIPRANLSIVGGSLLDAQ